MFAGNFMTIRNAVLAFITIFVLASPAMAGEKSFNKLPGRWVGNGWLQTNSGDKESIRCIATYFVKNGGSTLDQNLRCASASYTVVGKGALASRNGKISGTWSEENFNLTGDVAGSGHGGQLKLTVKGAKFVAKFLVKTRGVKQSVTISSVGTNIKKMVINLRKG